MIDDGDGDGDGWCKKKPSSRRVKLWIIHKAYNDSLRRLSVCLAVRAAAV